MAREPGQRGDRRDRRDRGGEEERDSEIVEKLVHINRVAATVKGGRRFSFAALMVVGDQKGRVGFGHGKAREVPEAIRKATEEAKKSMIRVPLRESRTLHHDGAGRHGAGKVILRSAPPGTGVIAGGRPRMSVFRSSKNIYVQVIDDLNGVTLAAASSLEGTGKGKAKAKGKGSDKDAAARVGALVAQRAIEKGVKDVVFDRGGYLYHGRVKALADAAREAGLNF